MKLAMKDMIKLSFGEEVGNAVSHGVAASLYLLLLPFMSVYAYVRGGTALAFGTGIFGICMFLMFIGSCIYHSMQHGSTHKYVMRKLDHSFIFLAIAGTYTPVLIYNIGGYTGIILLVVEWATTIGGIIMTAVSKIYHKKLALTMYLVMGWVAVFALPQIISSTTVPFLALIVLGGLFYTIGVAFYVQKWPYAHFVWHILIVLASMSHFIAIVFFI